MLIHSVWSAGKVLSEDVTLTFPTNVVQGSARCSVSVLGKTFYGPKTATNVWQNTCSDLGFL